MDENAAKDMGVLINAIGLLKAATGACILTIHHTGRNGGDARGSSSLDGAQDTELKVVRGQGGDPTRPECRLVQDKQKDMAEGHKDGLRLRFRVEPLGTDPQTGRALSSLVMCGLDAFQDASGIESVDASEWSVLGPDVWTKDIPGVRANSMTVRWILQALADLGHSRGLTQAECRRALKSKGVDPKKDDTWTNAWGAVVSNPVAVNLAGERWVLDQVALAEARGQGEVRDA
jgi:hypothetical protein